MFHLISMRVPEASVPAVQQVLAAYSVTWYRFAPMSWAVVSHHEAATWVQALRPLTDNIPNAQLLVCRLDVTDRQGLMPNTFWRWVADYQHLD
jgi:hypothetical protein